MLEHKFQFPYNNVYTRNLNADRLPLFLLLCCHLHLWKPVYNDNGRLKCRRRSCTKNRDCEHLRHKCGYYGVIAEYIDMSVRSTAHAHLFRNLYNIVQLVKDLCFAIIKTNRLHRKSAIWHMPFDVISSSFLFLK